MPALRDLYDEIWVYGLPQINKPLTGIDVPPSVRHKMVYTGYLHRELPLHADVPHEIGGDRRSLHPGHAGRRRRRRRAGRLGAARPTRPIRNIPYGAVIVFGPFMSATAREAFKERAAKFPNIRTLTFTNNLGALMQRAAGVVAMGGYNTFCEILSFDKRAIIVPRTQPRLEQFIRARAARNIGLIEMLDRRSRPRPAGDGDGAAPAAAAGPAERRRGAGPARRAGQRLAPRRPSSSPIPHRGPAPLEAVGAGARRRRRLAAAALRRRAPGR